MTTRLRYREAENKLRGFVSNYPPITSHLFHDNNDILWGPVIKTQSGFHKKKLPCHYNVVIMSAIIYSPVYSRRRSKKTPKLRVTSLWGGGGPPVTQRASNAENVSFDDVIMWLLLSVWASFRYIQRTVKRAATMLYHDLISLNGQAMRATTRWICSLWEKMVFYEMVFLTYTVWWKKILLQIYVKRKKVNRPFDYG